LLEGTRREAAAAGVTTGDVLPLGPEKTALMTWTGTAVQQTLIAMFASFDIDVEDEQVGLSFDRDESGVREAVQICLSTPPTPEVIAERFPKRVTRKYDNLLSDELLDVSIAHGRLEIPLAIDALRRMIARRT
jgi:hypothetical protein